MAEPEVNAPGGGGKDVKVFGAKLNKKTLYIGLAVGAGVLGYAYYSKRKNASATGTGTTAATDPAQQGQSGLGYNTDGYGNQAIDPNTGIPYAQEFGVGGGGGGGSTTILPAPASLTNAQWEQEAIANLEAGGVDQATITNAESGLPRYLAKLTMSQAQATAVQLAVGLTGSPPSGGPYSIRVAPTPPPPPKPKPPPKPPPKPKPPPEDERNFTEAQKRQAWAPGRARGELGSLYINGHWVSGVPRP